MQMMKDEHAIKNGPKPPSTSPTLAQRIRQSNRPTSAPFSTGCFTGGVCQHYTATSRLNDFDDDDSDDSHVRTTMMSDDSGDAGFDDDSDVSLRPFITGFADEKADSDVLTTVMIDDSSDAGLDDDSDVSQHAGSEAVTDVSQQLVQGVLIKVMDDVTTIVAGTHSHIDKQRTTFDQARWEEMSSKPFEPTVYQLQRAYFQLLHENFENQWCPDIADDVKNLAETLVFKLNSNANASIKETPALVINMFEQMQDIFKWEKIFRFSRLQSTLPKSRKQMHTNGRRQVEKTYERDGFSAVAAGIAAP